MHAPFPVHGLEEAMGLRRSPVGWFTFLGGATGFMSGLAMIWYMNSFDYRLVVGAKPYFSPIYAFPVAFELTILFGAMATVFGLLWLNRLPRHYHPLLKHPRFIRATHDRFYLVIECRDTRYCPNKTRRLLETSGGKNLELVED